MKRITSMKPKEDHSAIVISASSGIGTAISRRLSTRCWNIFGTYRIISRQAEAIVYLIDWAELIKLDAEGHKKEILRSTNRDHLLNMDALVEVENENNSAALPLFVTCKSERPWC